MIEALRENREVLAKDPGRIHALVDRIAIPHIDVDFFSRYVLGNSWREATPAQRARFLAAFKTYVIDSYADVPLRYKDQTVQVFPRPRGEAGQRIVTVPPGPPSSECNRQQGPQLGDRLVGVVLIIGGQGVLEAPVQGLKGERGLAA